MRELMVMFDLEATVIDSWNSGTPLPQKIDHMNRFINFFVESDQDKHTEPKFGVFSFAVDYHNEKDKARLFAAYTGREIEMDDKWIPCWKDLEDLLSLRGDIAKWEVVNFYGKGLMFDLWTRQFPDVDFILFDDVLPDKDSTTIRDSQMVRKIRV